jgi:protease-4
MTKQCFFDHLGIWACKPTWFQTAVQNYKQFGLEYFKQLTEFEESESNSDKLEIFGNGIAVLQISGPIMKKESKFGGTSTIKTRRLLQQSMRNDKVNGIMLLVDSNGGQVKGLQELSDDLQASTKPVRAFVEDAAHSAALRIAVNSDKISANAPASIGSIGTFAVLEDSSKAFEKAGVEVKVVSSGPFKGMGVEGTPITKEILAEVQKEVDSLNEFFLEDIQRGRNMSRSQVNEIADGRSFPAREALSLGLIDEITSFQKAVEEFSQQFPSPSARMRRRLARQKAVS